MSGTTDMIRIYSQNVQKNYVLLDSLLESQKDLYDILFIQEPPWNFICFAPSTTASGGDEVVGAPIHPDWTQVVRFPQSSEQTPRVMCFIHSRLSRLCFTFRRDIVDYRDIQLLSFFNRGQCQFLMNIYSDDLHTAVDFLSNAAPNIPHLLYIGGDFNVRDAEWDPSVSSYPAAGQSLMDLADSYSLVCSIPVLSVPTHYSDISGHANSVIDLIFLGISCAQVTHRIEPDLRRPSDHAPLIVDLPIAPENICVRRMVLKRDSEEEAVFLLSVSEGLSQLNFSSLDSTAGLDLLSEAISGLFADCWATYAKKNMITTRSKEW